MIVFSREALGQIFWKLYYFCEVRGNFLKYLFRAKRGENFLKSLFRAKRGEKFLKFTNEEDINKEEKIILREKTISLRAKRGENFGFYTERRQ